MKTSEICCVALVKSWLSSDQGYRRRSIGELMDESVPRPLDRFFRNNAPYGLDGNGHAGQRNRLHYMVGRVAKRAAFVSDLSDRMRVHGLDKAGQQNKSDAENPEPTGPRPLKTLFVLEKMHLRLTIEHNGPNRKTAGTYMAPDSALNVTNRQDTAGLSRERRLFEIKWILIGRKACCKKRNLIRSRRAHPRRQLCHQLAPAAEPLCPPSATSIRSASSSPRSQRSPAALRRYHRR